MQRYYVNKDLARLKKNWPSSANRRISELKSIGSSTERTISANIFILNTLTISFEKELMLELSFDLWINKFKPSIIFEILHIHLLRYMSAFFLMIYSYLTIWVWNSFLIIIFKLIDTSLVSILKELLLLLTLLNHYSVAELKFSLQSQNNLIKVY